MIPLAQQQQQQQQQAGMSKQAHMGMQQHGSSQHGQASGLQQGGYMQGMHPQPAIYAQPAMLQQQQQQAGPYPSMAQSYLSTAAEQASRPISPPGLPRGPSLPAGAAQRSQIKSPSGGFLGPQMIRPQLAANPLMAAQMAGSHMAGHHMMANQTAGFQMSGNVVGRSQMSANPMAGNHMSGHFTASNQAGGSHMVGSSAASPQSPAMLHPASPRFPFSNGPASAAAASPQLRALSSNTGSSRPNSASSQEGAGGSGQSHGALSPQRVVWSGQTGAAPQQPALRLPAGGQTGAAPQQAAYGSPANAHSWSSGVQAGMTHYSAPTQPGAIHGILL